MVWHLFDIKAITWNNANLLSTGHEGTHLKWNLNLHSEMAFNGRYDAAIVSIRAQGKTLFHIADILCEESTA